MKIELTVIKKEEMPLDGYIGIPVFIVPYPAPDPNKKFRYYLEIEE